MDLKSKSIIINKTALLLSIILIDCFMGCGNVNNKGENSIDSNPLQYKVVLDTIISMNNDSVCWFGPHAGVIPGNPSTIVLLLHEWYMGHSDVFRPTVSMRSKDEGKTWSVPSDRGDAFIYKNEPNGDILAPNAFVPKWNKYSQVMLATGGTSYFQNKKFLYGKRRWVVWSIYNPEANKWEKWSHLEMPDDSIFYVCMVSSDQRVDLPKGKILLPIMFKAKGEKQFTTTVAECSFDGKHLKYENHGDFLTVNVARGLYEPSLTYYGGKYYLTMRNDSTGYHAVSEDGLHFTDPKVWYFDNGKEVGTYNTQQHWVTHSDGLFLVYTRKGANNDSIFRSRAPLFMARVDTEEMVLIKNTEKIIVPNRGAPLGNFGVVNISKNETWVTVAERMSPDKEEKKGGADGNVFAARILWNIPNEYWDR